MVVIVIVICRLKIGLGPHKIQPIMSSGKITINTTTEKMSFVFKGREDIILYVDRNQESRPEEQILRR